MWNDFFKQPFPYFHNRRHIVVLIIVCVATVLSIVASFALEHLNLRIFILWIGGFTAVTALCSLAVLYLLPMLFKRFFDKNRWTKGKYLVFCVIITLTIGVANSFYNVWVGKMLSYEKRSYPFYLYVNIVTAFMVGIVPSAVGYFRIKNHRLHLDLQEKEIQNRLLTARTQTNGLYDDKLVALHGHTKESVTLYPHELIYLESSGNYIHIHYLINGKDAQKTIRATLLQMEEQLSDYPFIVRCHRAFMVNIRMIEKTKGFRILLKASETEIPVSKSCKANIQNLLRTSVYLSQK
jgi:hypothetical protein